MASMKQLRSPLVNYDTFISVEKIGSFPLHLHSLKDMDKALDDICRAYDPTTPEEEELLLNLCPYFGIVWPAARGLATFMSERKSQFTKKKGIEVGCGLALPAILAAKIGAQMQASDFHPDVGDWVTKNAELNHARIDYVKWDWTNLDAKPESVTLGQYDFVLASDVLYERRHQEDLVRALARLIHDQGRIYLSDPGRIYLENALNEFERLGFQRAEFSYEVEENSNRPEIRLEKKRTVQVFEFFKP
jgi:predicted nicotinamide N-methyase